MQKFEKVDIIKSLRAIMKTNTKHYQSDFDIDIEMLEDAGQDTCICNGTDGYGKRAG